MDMLQSLEQMSLILWEFEAESGDRILGKGSIYLTTVRTSICHMHESSPSSLYETHNLATL